MGITQHKHSVATVREIVNLQLLFGQLGKPGAGLCPVRGHSNVQGNRTMGIDEKPSAAMLDSLAAHFNFTPPRDAGHNTVQAIEAMLRDEVKVLITLGGNLAAAAPDTPRTEAALQRCALTVHISTKLNRSHLVPGHDALILPTLGRTDRDTQASGDQYITVEDSFSMVHASQGVNPPISDQLRSETAIVAGIAAAVLGEDQLNWRELAGNYDLIRNHIAATQPGFTDFNRRCDAPGGGGISATAPPNCVSRRRAARRNLAPPHCLRRSYRSCRARTRRSPCKPCVPTISTTPPSMVWMTAIAAFMASGRWCLFTRRIWPSWVLRRVIGLISKPCGMTACIAK